MDLYKEVMDLKCKLTLEASRANLNPNYSMRLKNAINALDELKKHY